MKVYEEFTVASKEPTYDPLKLKLFYISSGAPRLFDAILDAMTDLSVRIELNKKRTVAMLYQLCYGYSSATATAKSATGINVTTLYS